MGTPPSLYSSTDSTMAPSMRVLLPLLLIVGILLLLHGAVVDAAKCRDGEPCKQVGSSLYPIRCVEGDLSITNTKSAADLSSLANLAVIEGNLQIFSNDQLTTLKALDGITTIGGELTISYNDQLTTLTGLDGITTVGGNVQIYNNVKLTDLAGLDSIPTVGGNVQIYNNACQPTTTTTTTTTTRTAREKRCGTVKKIVTRYTKAEDLMGVTWVVGDLRFGRHVSGSSRDDDWHFVDEDVPVQARGIRCVEGDLSIRNTKSTVDLSPLANLVAVIGSDQCDHRCAGDLDISYNDQLTTLKALDGLTTVGGELQIWNNAQLTTLKGLDGITTVEGNLLIEDNDQLTTLRGLDGITTVGGDLKINNNAQLTRRPPPP